MRECKLAPNRSGPSPNQRARLGAIGVASGLGCSVVVSLLFFIGGGVVLDRALDSAPLWTLVGVAIGLVATGYQLWELTRIGVPDREPGPLGRRLSHLPGARVRVERSGREE